MPQTQDSKVSLLLNDFHSDIYEHNIDHKTTKDRCFSIVKWLIESFDEVEEFFNDTYNECTFDKDGVHYKNVLHSHEDYIALTPKPSGNTFYVHKDVSEMFTINGFNSRDIHAVTRLWLALHKDSNLGKLVFVSDKLAYAKAIGYDDIIFYSASDFTICDNESGYLRFNGGNKGQGKYGHNLRKEYKDTYLPMLRKIFNGKEDSHIKCAMSGDNLEQLTIEHPEDGEEDIVRQLGAQWHHVKYTRKKSDSKEGEPSKKFMKKSLEPKEWLEIFTCIPLRSDRHELVHQKLTGDAYDWVSWKNKGVAKQLPYVWRSEKKFQKVCEYLGIALEYDELISRIFYVEDQDDIDECKRLIKS